MAAGTEGAMTAASEEKPEHFLSDESTGHAFGEVIRSYEASPDAVWRFGKPNYMRVNKTYFEHRTLEHEPGSLEAVVGKLMKNWEVECHNIADIHQWKTMDISKFKVAVNGGCPFAAEQLAKIGRYNAIVGETAAYSGRANDPSSSHRVFSCAFPEGFAWECLEVFSGPPSALFKWRHFGKYTGIFTDRHGMQYKGNGKMINVVGLCVAKINSQMKLEGLDVYYNPEDLTSQLVTMVDFSSRVIAEDFAESSKSEAGCKPSSCACM